MKDFNRWNTNKIKIDGKNDVSSFMHEREVWWCGLGCNIGNEQDGKNTNFERPILIIKKFNREIVLAVPLSTKNKKSIYYYRLETLGASVIISQLRLISTKRLFRRIKKINSSTFEDIKEHIIKYVIN